MKLAELFVDAWVALPLQERDLAGALRQILSLVYRQGRLEEDHANKLARDLAFGSQGEVVRINADVVAVLGTLEGLDAPSVTVGVAPEAFRVTAEGRATPGEARAVVLMLAPRSLTPLRQQVLPVVERVLRDPDGTRRLLAAGTVEEIRGLKELMEAEVEERPLVEAALQPVRYRVYPDTPVEEILDLMVRRGLHAVPVVGDRYEVLGIVTTGDALAHLLRRGDPRHAPAERPAARDVMTRAVLCVAEDQAVEEAARMMVSRDVQQLPVVREGELVGFVTRDSVLRVLWGGADEDEEPDDEKEDSNT